MLGQAKFLLNSSTRGGKALPHERSGPVPGPKTPSQYSAGFRVLVMPKFVSHKRRFDLVCQVSENVVELVTQIGKWLKDNLQGRRLVSANPGNEGIKCACQPVAKWLLCRQLDEYENPRNCPHESSSQDDWRLVRLLSGRDAGELKFVVGGFRDGPNEHRSDSSSIGNPDAT